VTAQHDMRLHQHADSQAYISVAVSDTASAIDKFVACVNDVNHRRNFVCDGGDMSPSLLKVVVIVTTTVS